MSDDDGLTDAWQKIADAAAAAAEGQKIYAEKRTLLTKKHFGKFGAINTTTRKIYIDRHPEEAVQKFRQKAKPGEMYHLVRIGYDAAFEMKESKPPCLIAEEIYRENRTQLEAEHFGEFCAIGLTTHKIHTSRQKKSLINKVKRDLGDVYYTFVIGDPDAFLDHGPDLTLKFHIA